MIELPEEIWAGYESCPIIPGNGHLKAYKKETHYANQKYTRSPQWQPIGTAPKDGTEIQIIYTKQGNVRQLISWNKIHNYWQSKGKPQIGLENQFILWMPLPPPPEKKL